MNDPRFHPYPSIGYRAPVHAFRPQGMQRQFGGPPQGRLIGRPPRQAAGRRMGHLPPCVTNQGEEIGYPPKFSGPYPGGINAQGPAFNHHARAMGRSPSRFRGPGGGPRGRRGLRCSTKQESGWCCFGEMLVMSVTFQQVAVTKVDLPGHCSSVVSQARPFVQGCTNLNLDATNLNECVHLDAC